MCNLYRMTRSLDEVAHLFDASPHRGANFGAEIYPGYPGAVVAQGACRTMTWGFPLALKGKNGKALRPKPVNNAREDKLTTQFWNTSLASRRCLIPMSGWAEAQGRKGKMTRTWYSLPGGEPFAVAGLWRPTDEWGDAYSMVMVDSSAQMADVHDRMPLILERTQWQRWIGGPPDEALGMCRTWPGKLVVDRTAQRWSGDGAVASQQELF